MHPAIRVLCCVIFIILLSRAGWVQLGLALIILFAMHAMLGWRVFLSSLSMIKRLRWLLLSIMVLSLWFTPGEALLPEYTSISPTLEGLLFGLNRVVILAEIISAINLMLSTTSTEELVSALQWLLQPLKVINISAEKLSLRIVLTLDAVRNFDIDMRSLVKNTQGHNIIQRTALVVTQAYSQTVSTKSQQDTEIVIKRLAKPAIVEWLWLPTMLVIYYIPWMVL